MKFRLVALSLALVLSACGGGGGGGGSSVAPAGGGGVAPAGSASLAEASVTITIPAVTASSAARRPQYVSAATNSMTISSDSGTSVVSLAPTSPNCSTVNGGRSCAVQLNLPTGASVPFTVRTFASSDGSGTPLSIAVAASAIVPNQVNTLSLTLNAVLNSLQVVVASPAFAAGAPSSTNVTVNLRDAANQIIVVGANNVVDVNNSPVTVGLQLAGDANALTIAPATVGATPSTLAYAGGPAPANASVVATAVNASNAVVTSASAAVVFSGSASTPAPTPSPSPTPAATPTPTPAPTATPSPTPSIAPVTSSVQGLAFTDVGAGYAQSFTVSQDGNPGAYQAVVTGGTSGAATVAVSGNTITVTPQAAGATNIVVTGTGGASITVPVSVTVTTLHVSGRR